MWAMLFAVIALFSDYLHLIDEEEYKYLFERPYIWQEYAFWMLAEILIFVSSILSNALYLTGRQFSRDKLENAAVQKFAFYRWAGPEVITQIELDQNKYVDFMCSGSTKRSLIFLATFASPFFINLIVLQTKYFDVLTTEQMNVFELHTIFLMLQTFGSLLLIFRPFSAVDYKFVRSISSWITRLFFGLTFFAIPVLAWVYSGLAYSNNVFNLCHMNVWFLGYLILNICHIFLGIYASFVVLTGLPDEITVEILRQES